MKTFDFINSNIGQSVYITGDGDLAMCGEFRKHIFGQTEFKLLGLTKGGLAKLQELDNNYITVKPRNVRLYSELK